MTPQEYCQKKAVQSGSSFYYSFLFLTPPKREAMIALYAFCREVDDIVDECNEPTIARKKLAWWQEEIERIFQQKAQHPVGKALSPWVTHFQLNQHWFEEILAGMLMDIDFQGYATFADLKIYCYRVAGVVGLLSAKIFGCSARATLEYAKNLGICLQLVNIIRDLGEDARRGRIYLPHEELAQFDLQEADILSQQASPEKLTALLAFQATRAQDYYQQALNLLPQNDRVAQRPGLIMASIYLALLQEIAKIHFAVLDQKISLTPLRKLWIAWKTAQHEKKIEKKNKAT